jgi:glycosyltransferase involved in cell wall biosynthesis
MISDKFLPEKLSLTANMKRENIPVGQDKPYYARINKASVSGFQRKARQSVQISIIIPSLNQGRTIETAIRSILDQGLENLEIIVADGGSTDGTLPILERLFLEIGSRITWISEQDHGPAHAINKAIAMSTGSIVAWLNADDRYAHGAIAVALRHLEGHPDCLMLYGRAMHIDETGEVLDEVRTSPAETAIEAFRDACFISQPAVFLRRALFTHVGLLDEGMSASYAFEFWLRVFKDYQSRVAYLSTVLAYSRQDAMPNADAIVRHRRRALECTKALGAHLGSASPAWLLGYFDALFEQYPFIAMQNSAIEDCLALLEECSDAFSEADARALHAAVRSDARFRVAHPDAYITIASDGWAGSFGILRVRYAGRKWTSLRLVCRHAPPTPRPLIIKFLSPWGTQPEIEISRPGIFEIDLPLPEHAVSPSYLSIPFIAETSFVPSEEAGADSDDSRELSFIVERLELR